MWAERARKNSWRRGHNADLFFGGSFAAEIVANKEMSPFATRPDVKVRYFRFCVERVGPGGKRNADIIACGDATVAHLRNFFHCIRSRKEPNCPFEIGFRSAIACSTAITSYREKQTVCWDDGAEEI